MNLTPEQLEIIQDIAKKIAKKNVFPGYEEDDIKQEIFLIAVEALPRFDQTKSAFRTFMYTHINNRLHNLRNRAYVNEGSPSKDEKRKIVKPQSGDLIEYTVLDDFFDKRVEEIDRAEIFDYIEKNLHSKFREDYLRIKEGVSVVANREARVFEAIRTILKTMDDE